MFSFGLFSSGIPYILIIAVHVVYFAAFTLNKLRGAEEDTIAKTINNQAFDENHNSEENYIYYSDVSSYEEASNASIEKSPVIRIKKEKCLLSNDSPSRQFFFNSTFSRPPPSRC